MDDAGAVQMSRMIAVEIEAPYLQPLWRDDYPMQSWRIEDVIDAANNNKASD